MTEAILLLLAGLASTLGMAWLALAMDAHWQQVNAANRGRRRHAATLRWRGTLTLAGSMALCFAADHPTMAALVWIMSLGPAALIVTFVLAWRPGWLAFLQS